VAGDGGLEGGHDDRAGDPPVRDHGQGEPGVIIEPGQDLSAGAVGERVVGEVGLPASVRLLGLESDVGRFRPFPRLGGDQATGGQVPADRRRRDCDLVIVVQMPGDRIRPGV
jgi:hypothetical protein